MEIDPGMSQDGRKSQPDMSLGDFGLLGSGMKLKNKMGFYKESDADFSENSAYFPPSSMFTSHKDLLTSQSQSLSQFGIYGQHGLGLQQAQSQQQQSGMQRGMPNPQQQTQQQLPFPSRSMSGHHGSIGGQITPTPPSPSRGMLPVGPRVSQAQTSTNQGSMGRVGTLGSGMPSPNSRTSPSLVAMQQKQQQQRMLGGSTQSTIGAFGMTRQQSYGGPQNTLLGNFTPQSLAASFNAVNENTPSLDMSDFPVLANRGRQQPTPQQIDNNSLSLFPPNPMAGRPAYVGMVNKQADPVPEFTMQSEDFPALPGSNIMNKSTGTALPPGPFTTFKQVSKAKLSFEMRSFSKPPPNCFCSCVMYVVFFYANLTGLYLHHAKFHILLMYMVLLRTLLDCISTMQSFKSYSCTWCYCKPYEIVSPPCKVSNPTHVHGVTANHLHHAKFQILLMSW